MSVRVLRSAGFLKGRNISFLRTWSVLLRGNNSIPDGQIQVHPVFQRGQMTRRFHYTAQEGRSKSRCRSEGSSRETGGKETQTDRKSLS